MKPPSPSRADGSAARSLAERRLDAGFQSFVARTMEQRPGWSPCWSPTLRAEIWCQFALECKQLIRAAAIPEIFQGVDLDSLSSRLPAGYLELARIMLDMLEKPMLLAVGGPRGTGKTALASGLAKEFCEVGRPAIYTTAHEFFDHLTSTDWQAKEDYRARHHRPDLLIIDEVQVRDAGKEWQDNELTTLIDIRHRSAKSTLLLSNLAPGALKNNLGDSIWRRLIKTGGQPIETDWPDLQEWVEKLRGAA